VQALQREITQVAGRLSYPVEVGTIFFGGGTPTYIPVEGLEDILDTCRRVFRLSEDCEISVEANPGTVSRVS